MSEQRKRQLGGRTQRDRVLRAGLRAGARGITRADFLAPDVCDCGAPILNFNARVSELRDLGWRIETRGRRQRCVVHVFISAGPQPTPHADPLPASALFEAAPASRSAFDPWDGDRP